MTTTVLRPNGVLQDFSDSIVGVGNASGVTADNTDASYVVLDDGDRFQVNLTTKTFAVGEITKSAIMRCRARVVTGDSLIQLEMATINPSETIIASSGNIGFTETITTKSGGGVSSPLSSSDVDSLALKVRYPAGSATIARIYELYVDLVTVAKPVATLTAVTPDPYTAGTLVPLAWTRTLDADGGGQTRYQVQVTDDDDGDAVVFDSGEVIGSNETANAGPLNNGNYTAKVRVGQTVNGVTHWSAYDTDQFTLTVSTSDVSTVVGTADDANGNIDVVVTRDGTSEAWDLIEVERSFDAGVSWSPVRTATLVDSTGDANTFSVTDHEVPNGQATIYRARATYDNAGASITGPWTESASVSWSSSVNWLKSPLAPSLNSEVKITRWPTQSRDSRAGVFYPIGSAQPVVVSDVLTSSSGSVTFKVTGSAESLALDALLADSSTLILNLVPASLTGPNRDGFQYVNPISVSEAWLTRNYRDASGDKEIRLVTLNFATSSRPPDGTAGTL